MAKSPDPARRWTGGIFLGVAVLMVVLGLTLFHSSLQAYAFIAYWMVCMGFTLAAAMVALIDVMAVRREAMREQEELLEQTLKAAGQKEEL